MEVVSLACGLVGGETVLSYLPESMALLISQALNHPFAYQMLRFLEALLGKVPVIHIEDVCEAHVFCMEKPSVTAGRFLCASAYLSTKEIAHYIRQYYPELHIGHDIRFVDEELEAVGVKWGSTKLNDLGFEYKCDIKMIIDHSIQCAKKMGALS
ncbi:PREDICTED: dihydroflavonol 4-reductase-like [Nelumbo nucifera]|uniref:Dihydroflavonol 4-reductase-like n=1 Tax=Nelumbo nucifera TaxID=4432 RepID=A0A1U8Q8P3_NELNU|nr:PREDICTED: dihydroflavonol 4-reductase-like [Nelumbo nucifera]